MISDKYYIYEYYATIIRNSLCYFAFSNERNKNQPISMF